MTYRVLSVDRLLGGAGSVGPVLGFDTGSPMASLGLVAQGKVLGMLNRPVKSHCADLPEAVEQVLSSAGLALSDLAGVAIAIGPGSFTGLRVGLAYGKGLAMALGIAMLGVPSLDSIALCALARAPLRPGTIICPILDARRDEVYTGLYRLVDDELEKVTGDLVIRLEDLAPHITGEVVLVGESKAEEARELWSAHGAQVALVGSSELHRRGSLVAALGAARLARNDVDDAAALEPLYVRAAEQAVQSIASNLGEGSYGTSRGRTDPAACGS
jgi:tRNA threonylcarbamoyladenosine biosynthesis protein TsaB